ncbi:MAG TPA: protein kinase [Anaerolineae bacterium]|nr:protein kinase [Anaerolineae bacterium]
MIGRVLKGKYKIYDKVGSGGFATVYLGRNIDTNEIVAIKVLSEQFTEDARYVERFRREASLAERLQHPNIVRILDHGIENSSHFLVMEFVEGLTLEQLIERRGGLPVEEALSYVQQACAGLEAAYQAGIVHRDIKPANLMITPGGTVKIMDFGIARMDAAVGLTQSGVFMGTPRYISPEMARGSGADVRSDLYALGLLTYEMLAGAPPFDGDNPWAVLRQQIEVDPAPLSEVRLDVPAWIEAIIRRAVAKDPARRYQTPGDMLAALHEQNPSPAGLAVARTIGPAGVPAMPAGRPAGVTRVSAPPQRTRRAPRALLFSLVIVAAVGVGVFFFLSGQDGDGTPRLTPSTVEVSGPVAGLVTDAPTSTLAPFATDTPSASDTSVPEPTATFSPEPTATPEPSHTPEPVPTDTPEPTATVPASTDTPVPPPADTSAPPTQGPTNTPEPTVAPTSPPPPAVSGRIVYSAGGTLHIVDAATGQDTVSPIPGLRHPDFRRDGAQIIANGEGGARASVLNVDANSGRILNDQSSFTDDYHPFWSPGDPGRFVYDSIHHGLPQFGNMLYIQGLTSGQPTAEDTVAYEGRQIQGKSPVWMDDDWLAFTGCNYWEAGGGSKCGIYRMPSWDGHPSMVHPGSTDMRATDSYGSQIVFMSQESGNWEVYLIGAGGGAPRNLSNSAGSDDGLGTFSPDGKMIAFASNRGGGWAVWATGLDGSAPVKLFNLPAAPTQPWYDESMSWGP